MILTKRRRGKIEQAQSKNNTNKGFHNLKFERKNKMSIVKGNQDGSKFDTDGNQKANINTLKGNKHLIYALTTLVEQAT